MCHAAVNWVISEISKREDLKPAEKWFMVVLADHADRHFWSFIHGHGTLAKDAGMSKRTVVTMLARFEEISLLRRSTRFRLDGSRSTDLISLLGSENPALGDIQGAKSDNDHVQIATPEGVKFAQHKEGTKPGKRTLVVSSTREAFEVWWKAYPLKKAKDAAARAFESAWGRIEGDGRLDVLLSAIGPYVEECRRLDRPLKHPATWLNGGCWNDEPDTSGSQADGRRGQATGVDFAAERHAARVRGVVAGFEEALNPGRRQRWRM